MAMDGPDLFWGPWIIWPVLFWITLFWLMKLGVSRRAHFRHRNGDSAEGILRERFARGEITADEYERALGALRGRSPDKDYEDYVREAEEELRSEPEDRPRQ
jgi:putative membrane protein